jgi:signal transduction histidine kinase
MLTKISDLYQLTAEKKKINLSVAISEQVVIHCDENMIYVTLRNLVSNALKFTEQGKSVKITAIKNHQYAEITIQDEGVGMNDAYVKKLLSEDQLPLKKGTSNEKGTGLGLILCKKFVHLNNGHLHVTSEEGKGTEFIVKLPLA